MSDLLFVWPSALEWAGKLMGRRKAPKATGPSAREERRSHPWADWQARSSQEPSAVSNHTRPMSWLGPASSGAHPRTKGARFCAGGHRHRIPLTARGLPMACVSGQAIGRPFAVGGRNADQRNARGAIRGEVTFRSRGRGRLGGARTRIKKALRAGLPAGHAGHEPCRRKRARLTGEQGRSEAFAAATARA